MLQQGMTALMEYDGEQWHETSGSVKHRIREALGFAKHDITLMESGGNNGIVETVSFTFRGLGWYLNFTSGKVGRASEWDDSTETDDGNDDGNDES